MTASLSDPESRLAEAAEPQASSTVFRVQAKKKGVAVTSTVKRWGLVLLAIMVAGGGY